MARVFRPGLKTLMGIVFVLMVFLAFNFCLQYGHLATMQQDVRQMESQVRELRQKNEELRRQLQQVQSDSYIEQMAREKLGLVKPGETRIITRSGQ
ncbi:MAG: FtsB family cell division protein [Desulfurispora sp.]|uniref:FtsB family cell division protein n=1 Tax=Desulfurispora sp. TaxID=3014275 RepID=UPI00404B80D8